MDKVKNSAHTHTFLYLDLPFYPFISFKLHITKTTPELMCSANSFSLSLDASLPNWQANIWQKDQLPFMECIHKSSFYNSSMSRITNVIVDVRHVATCVFLLPIHVQYIPHKRGIVQRKGNIYQTLSGRRELALWSSKIPSSIVLIAEKLN